MPQGTKDFFVKTLIEDLFRPLSEEEIPQTLHGNDRRAGLKMCFADHGIGVHRVEFGICEAHDEINVSGNLSQIVYYKVRKKAFF